MKANKFVAKLGNDTMIKVYFYDTDGGRVVAGMGDQPQQLAPFDISGAKDVRVELVDVMRGKRTKMSPMVDKHIMSIELNEDVQRLGEYFLDIRFGMPNVAFSDGVQAYRLKLSGIAIVESGETSGDIGATFEGLMVGGMSRAELLAEVEQLKQDKTVIETELSEMTEAKAQAESERDEANRAKTTAETERDQALEGKATAETERDEANKAKTTAETERDEALEGKAQAESERDQALESKATAETERDEANKAKTTAETERDQALQDKATAETERDEANRAKATAEGERDQALEGKATAEGERDQALEGKATAETERDEANKAKESAETERDQALQDKATAETERDEANRAKATAETERDEAIQQSQGLSNYLRKEGNISNSVVTKVDNQAFFYSGSYGRYNLADTVQLPAVIEIGVEAFRGCRVNRFDLPSVTVVRRDAFRHLDGWDVTVMMPKVETVEEGAFLDLPAHSTVYVSETYFDSLPSSNDELRKTFSIQRGAMDGTVTIVIEAVESKRQRLYEEFHAPQGW